MRNVIVLFTVVVVCFLILIILMWQMKGSLIYERKQNNLPVVSVIEAFGKCNLLFLNCSL